MANPFDKYLGKEDILQSACKKYLNLQYPKILWFHTPNEGKRTRFEQYKFDILGGKRDVSDILIFEKNTLYSGLAIELKIKPNKPTESQTQFLNDLSSRGWQTAVCYSLDEFINVVNSLLFYFKASRFKNSLETF